MSNLFSKLKTLMFSDVSHILEKGKREDVKYEDFISLPDTDLCHQKENSFVEDILTNNDITNIQIISRLIWNNLAQFVRLFSLNLMTLLATLSVPLLLTLALHKLEGMGLPSDKVLPDGLLLTILALVAMLVLRSFLYIQSVIVVQRYFIIVKRMLVRLVLAKVMRVGKGDLDDKNSGDIQNLISDDTSSIANFPRVILDLALTIIQLIALSGMLYWQLGAVALLGIVCLVISIVAQTSLMNHLNKKLHVALELKDQRLSMIGELIKKFRLIRMTGLVNRFASRIHGVREKETAYLFRCHLTYTVMQVVMLTTPLIISIVTFSLYLSLGENINAAKAFSVIAMFSLLRSPMMRVAGIFFEASSGLVGLRRLIAFLKRRESHLELNDDSINLGSIQLRNVSLDSRGRSVLSDINLSIKPGELIAITGETGCGKTALLNSIAGYDNTVKGEIKRHGRVSHLQHYMWLANDTLRNNIVFGRDYDKDRYLQVLAACQLNYDLDLLPAGDQTLVGELGSRLSGGQQQRVALARALYSESDILLFDNPMSALDPNVANQLFSNAIINFCSKTRVLVMSDPKLIQQCDRAFELQDGTLYPIDLTAYAKYNARVTQAVKLDQPPEKRRDSSDKYDDEQTQSGNVEWSLLKEVFKQSGSMSVLFIIILLIGGAEVLRLLSELYLAGQSTQTIHTVENFLHIYWILGLSAIGIIGVSQFLLMTRVINHTRNSHRILLDRVINAPMSFFDANPQGRIINRFSTDIEVCSGHLLVNMATTVTIALALLIQVAFITTKMPLFFAMVLVIGAMYWRIQQNYRLSARAVRRIQSVIRSPLYSSVSEAIRGAAALRLNRIESYATEQVMYHLERDMKGTLTGTMLQSWLWVRQGLLSAMITAVVAGLVIITGGGALGALALTYAVLASSSIAQLIGNLAIVEWDMNSAWRVGEYCLLEQENKLQKHTSTTTSYDFLIEFNNVSLNYSNGQCQALRGVSFQVKKGEKIGICGRSGSGKSSLFNALLAMYPISGGNIQLAGIDASCTSPEYCRNYASIMTQTPLTFSGSLRSNVDPENHHSKEEIAAVLDKVGLSTRIEALGGNLDTSIDTAKLSAGETQLLVLARALLQKRSVVLLDEATSDMDQLLVKDIIETLYREKSQASFLLISHHRAPLMQMDRVLVMEDGEIVEEGFPSELIADYNSRFYAMFAKHC